MILPLLMLAAGTDLRPANMAQCRAEKAVAVTVEQLTAAAGQFEGKCVTVSGPAWRRSMYSGVDGFYLTYRLGPDGWTGPEGRRRRVGLNFTGPWAGLESLRSLSVTGVADSCERMRRVLDAEDEAEERLRKRTGSQAMTIRMLSGYCHFYPGPVVWVTDFKQDVSRLYERRVGEEARRSVGSLVEVAPQWPRYSGLLALARQARKALGDRDRQRLTELFAKGGNPRPELEWLLEKPGTPFRELHDPDFDAPLAIFADAAGQYGVPAAAVPTLDGYVCFCRTGDCQDKWPIAEIDTRMNPDHPYACFDVDTDGAGAVYLESRRGYAPLREPPGSAFRPSGGKPGGR
ncbi:MAG TPA: hypothetical protein VF589_08790 [Allosphingosinicella sp.]|jgi:hypothetical protein